MTKRRQVSRSATRVLVVEDRENWRETFSRLLRHLGYEVAEASCGEEFRDKAKDGGVIVLDISMPGKPGDPESKTTGLDILLELQRNNPSNYSIQAPIVRSMWEKEDFRGTQYESVRVAHWVSRNLPSAQLVELIGEVEEHVRKGQA